MASINKRNTAEAISAMDAALSQGAFTAISQPPAAAQRLVSDALKSIRPRLSNLEKACVLECGCGSGAWIAYLLRNWPELRPQLTHGFDLSPALVNEARKRLNGLLPERNLKPGDVLDPSTYKFPAGSSFDLIYTYDVVQQLPLNFQGVACATMFSRVKPGGFLLVFDCHMWSPYGVFMAMKKFATYRLGVPIVPKYYCAARYPNLNKLTVLLRDSGADCELIRIPGIVKRALVARRRAVT